MPKNSTNTLHDLEIQILFSIDEHKKNALSQEQASDLVKANPHPKNAAYKKSLAAYYSAILDISKIHQQRLQGICPVKIKRETFFTTIASALEKLTLIKQDSPSHWTAILEQPALRKTLDFLLELSIAHEENNLWNSLMPFLNDFPEGAQEDALETISLKEACFYAAQFIFDPMQAESKSEVIATLPLYKARRAIKDLEGAEPEQIDAVLTPIDKPLMFSETVLNSLKITIQRDLFLYLLNPILELTPYAKKIEPVLIPHINRLIELQYFPSRISIPNDKNIAIQSYSAIWSIEKLFRIFKSHALSFENAHSSLKTLIQTLTIVLAKRLTSDIILDFSLTSPVDLEFLALEIVEIIKSVKANDKNSDQCQLLTNALYALTYKSEIINKPLTSWLGIERMLRLVLNAGTTSIISTGKELNTEIFEYLAKRMIGFFYHETWMTLNPGDQRIFLECSSNLLSHQELGYLDENGYQTVNQLILKLCIQDMPEKALALLRSRTKSNDIRSHSALRMFDDKLLHLLEFLTCLPNMDEAQLTSPEGLERHCNAFHDKMSAYNTAEHNSMFLFKEKIKVLLADTYSVDFEYFKLALKNLFVKKIPFITMYMQILHFFHENMHYPASLAIPEENTFKELVLTTLILLELDDDTRIQSALDNLHPALSRINFETKPVEISTDYKLMPMASSAQSKAKHQLVGLSSPNQGIHPSNRLSNLLKIGTARLYLVNTEEVKQLEPTQDEHLTLLFDKISDVIALTALHAIATSEGEEPYQQTKDFDVSLPHTISLLQNLEPIPDETKNHAEIPVKTSYSKYNSIDLPLITTLIQNVLTHSTLLIQISPKTSYLLNNPCSLEILCFSIFIGIVHEHVIPMQQKLNTLINLVLESPILASNMRHFLNYLHFLNNRPTHDAHAKTLVPSDNPFIETFRLVSTDTLDSTNIRYLDYKDVYSYFMDWNTHFIELQFLKTVLYRKHFNSETLRQQCINLANAKWVHECNTSTAKDVYAYLIDWKDNLLKFNHSYNSIPLVRGKNLHFWTFNEGLFCINLFSVLWFNQLDSHKSQSEYHLFAFKCTVPFVKEIYPIPELVKVKLLQAICGIYTGAKEQREVRTNILNASLDALIRMLWKAQMLEEVVVLLEEVMNFPQPNQCILAADVPHYQTWLIILKAIINNKASTSEQKQTIKTAFKKLKDAFLSQKFHLSKQEVREILQKIEGLSDLLQPSKLKKKIQTAQPIPSPQIIPSELKASPEGLHMDSQSPKFEVKGPQHYSPKMFPSAPINPVCTPAASFSTSLRALSHHIEEESSPLKLKPVDSTNNLWDLETLSSLFKLVSDTLDKTVSDSLEFLFSRHPMRILIDKLIQCNFITAMTKDLDIKKLHDTYSGISPQVDDAPVADKIKHFCLFVCMHIYLQKKATSNRNFLNMTHRLFKDATDYLQLFFVAVYQPGFEVMAPKDEVGILTLFSQVQKEYLPIKALNPQSFMNQTRLPKIQPLENQAQPFPS